MTPTNFPEANTQFKAPSDMDESQVATIPAHVCEVRGGSCDGVPMVVVAWMPSEQEIRDIVAGKPIFLSMFGGLSPHYLTTSFEQSINCA